MSEVVRKIEQNPEDYSPKDKPEILNMMEEHCAEKIIDTIVIEGVAFTVIEKPKTLYAGIYAAEQDADCESDFNEYETDDVIFFKERQPDEEIKVVCNSITPDRKIILNIDYETDERPCAMLIGQETTSYEQPEGIHVIEAEPTLLIKVKHTHAAFELTKKLTGKYIHQYQLSELFDLIKHIFCAGEQSEYEFNGDNGSGNSDAEHHSIIKEGVGYLGSGYVTVPVKRRNEHVGSGTKKYNKANKNAVIAESVTLRSEQDIQAIQSAQKEFEKIKFGGREWLVLDKEDGKALIMSEAVEYRKFHHSEVEVTWADCELRKYLNNEYYNAFDESEKARILQTTLPPCYANPWHGPGGGKSRLVRIKEKSDRYEMEFDKCTEEKIFLLSIEELIKYTGDSGDLEKRVGWYWGGEDTNDMKFNDGFGQFLFDQYNTARIAKNKNDEASWWRLRSPGCLYLFTVVVSPVGAIILTGTPHTENGIRPAMWIKI